MTEDEAKTKWCPFVRYRLTGTEAPVNRDSPERDEGAVFNCIASACMAWRTRPDFNPITNPEGAPIGFCGLAGAPS